MDPSYRPRPAAGPKRVLMGPDPMGHLPLHEVIADYLIASRAVWCSSRQIVIGSGIQEALDIQARLLFAPGNLVCMKNAGYTGAAMVLAVSAARIHHVPVDDEGIDTWPCLV